MTVNKKQPQLHPKYRPDIDGLRAIAVISVVIFHAFPNFLPGGFIGVDIFFVISGFLISSILVKNLEKNSFSFLDFYSRRIRRIFPSLLLMLTAVFIVGWNTLSTGEFAQLGKHIAGGAGFVSNLIFWNESGYFDNSAHSKPLLNLWSLGIEEQFYLFWPLLVWIWWRFRYKFSSLIIALGISLFVLNIYLVRVDVTADFYCPLTRFWELLIGAFLASNSINKQAFNKLIRNLLSFFGLTLICVGLIFLNGSTPYPGAWALLPTIGAVLIIFAGNSAFLNKEILSSRILVWFGLISFPLYLWHWPILTFWGIVTLENRSLSVSILLIVLSIFLSWVSYKFLEEPVRSRGGVKVTFVLLILMSAIGYTGYNTYIREGLPSRKASKDTISFELNKQIGVVPDCSVGSPENIVVNFPKECFSKKSVKVFLWGDSHVANFHYGLTDRKIQDLNIDLKFAMKGGCPPVVNFLPRENSTCITFNQFAIEQIKKYQPDTVVLLANWSLYNGIAAWHKLENKDIISTVKVLKNIGIKHVILIGNFPVYELNQSKIGMRIFKSGVEDRTYKRIDFSSVIADKRIEILAREEGIKFLSPVKALCNEDGCLMSVSTSEFIPVAYDISHLTFSGSTFFIDKNVDKQFFR